MLDCLKIFDCFLYRLGILLCTFSFIEGFIYLLE